MNYAPGNVLITGGAGFIGSHVAIHLATKYPRVKVRTFPTAIAHCYLVSLLRFWHRATCDHYFHDTLR